MFTRWLLTVFPEDLRIGWQLLRPNLVLWIALAASAALAVPVAARLAASESHQNLVALGVLTGSIGLAQAVVCIPLFDDAYRRRPTDWVRARRLLMTRAVPFLAAAMLTVGGGLLVAELAMSAIRTILQTTPVAELAIPLFGVVLYVSLLVRFCYVPFLIVLCRRASLPDELSVSKKFLQPLLVLLWPFSASSRLSEGRRWRLVPYIALLYLFRLAQPGVPANLQIVYSLATVIVGLVAQAVLFRYFTEQLEKLA